jgi:ribosome biogenesis SPOUT family RNA methylase Rps3
VVLLFEMTSVVETPTSLIYVIEHMETNLSEWVRNEYTRMVKDVGGGNLLFTNMKPGTNCPSFDSDEMSFLSTATLVSETFQEYHDAKDGDRTKAVLLDEKSGMSCTRWLVQLLFPC